MAYLVIVVAQEGNNKQFRVCLMSQSKPAEGLKFNPGEGPSTGGGGGGGGGGSGGGMWEAFQGISN